MSTGADHRISRRIAAITESATLAVDAKAKAAKLAATRDALGLKKEQVIALGDGANDLLMLQKAGHGIAFHAKPKLREAAHTAISRSGLDAILYLLGIAGRDIAALEA